MADVDLTRKALLLARALINEAMVALTARSPAGDEITIKVAAKRAGITERQMRRLMSANKALGHKVGRVWFVKSEPLRAFLADRNCDGDVR